MRARTLAWGLAAAAALGAASAGLPSNAVAAPSARTGGAVGPPTTPDGRPAELVAGYVETPTGFAFSPHHVFMSDGTVHPLGIGGVYVLAHGTARRLAKSPAFSSGVAWHGRTLYISAGDTVLAWRGWNGRKFTHRRTIYTAPSGFTGFNGLAFASGRLYLGVDKGAHNDHRAARSPYEYDILSMTPRGRHVRVEARGIRQPWQLAFAHGSSSPFVTDLGQDSGASNAPDLLLRVRRHQDYGFPDCNWTRTALCRGYAQPLRLFPAHSDPMGLAISGPRIYLSEFGVRTPAQVISLPLSAAASPKINLSGFPPHGHILGLGANDGWIYVGETAASKKRLGSVWRFQPSPPSGTGAS
jgi:glucose/arabinose dehydrogenase